MRRVRAAFIPLVDSAPLIAAERMGFAREEGVALELTRERSWATLRDKLAVGAVEAAHLLAPITVASTLGLGNPKPPMVALMGLSMNGNAISVSAALYDEMREVAPIAGPDDLLGKARALCAVTVARRASGRSRLTFGIVHTFSPHHYELRYLLAAGGVDPDRDVDLVVVPPPYVVDHLRAGHIDGFCVGAPWTSLGLNEGLSRVIAVKAQIWNRGPEKVLGMRAAAADADPDLAGRLIRAVSRGAAYADDPANHEALSQMLAEEAVLAMDPAPIADSLAGRVPLDVSAGAPIADYVFFGRDGAGFPWQSHALWFYAQMVRWGQAAHDPSAAKAAASAYRPDLYRAAFAPGDVALPAADRRVEAGDAFFDGHAFDPSDIDGYVSGFQLPR
ncbi:MAG: CmpA/NrtA family ABC transporter substrate-binding protein [Pseudomonadota bacterium]